MNRLRKLANYGQSYWMDDLSRDLLRNGDLPRKIRDTGLRGITSNPAIFGQAIGGSAAYDEQIARGARSGRSALQIYEDLTCQDIRDACDALLPVHQETGGVRRLRQPGGLAPAGARHGQAPSRKARISRSWSAAPT